MSRHIFIFAKSARQAAQYAQRKGLSISRYRAVAKPSSIRGLQVGDAHILPEFWERPDCHAIMSEIRYARDIVKIEVTMPDALEVPAKDQGDGMGEQLSLDDLVLVGSSNQILESDSSIRKHKSVDPVIEFSEGSAADSTVHVDEAAANDAAEQAPRKRRSRCRVCGHLTFTSYEDDREGHDVDAHKNSGFFG